MKVFVSYSSLDKARVFDFATALRGRGIDVWLDDWELRAGDSVVPELSSALDKAEAAVVLFSQHHEN
ncbi:MAG: toll/interleukin-1 receptor domain-containing protein, partial [Planctomycetaceae bacterium]